MTITELDNNPQYYEHHTAYKRGYLSRRATYTEAEPYAGKFGVGYTFEHPAWHTTNYHYITYYIQK